MANSSPDAERNHYLSHILRYEPENLETLMNARRRFRNQSEAELPPPTHEARRLHLENHILRLEATLFTDEGVRRRDQLALVDWDAFPLLQQRYEQLDALLALREVFARAARDPELDGDFLIWFKRLAAAPPRAMKQWRGFTQAYFQDGYYLAEFAAQINHLHSAYPQLYALQAEWFDLIRRRPARSWKTVF